MKKILITALGTITATSIVQELRMAQENFYIIGADINEPNMVVTSKDVDEFYQFPSSVENPEKFLRFILDFCQKYQIDYIFPVIDEEVVNYAKNRQLFEDIHVKVCIANEDLILICHYKDKFSEWVAQNIPECAIKTYSIEEKIEYPVFVKPIEGRASNGCRVVHDQEELNRSINLESCIIQEYIQGEFITADLIQNYKYGQYQCIQRLELIRNKNGCGIAVKTVNNSLVESACYKIAEKLKLDGVVNVEFIVKKDRVQIVEVNPRFSAGSYFSFMAGCNLAEEAIHIADNEKCRFGDIQIGKNYARRYETYGL